MADSPKSIPPLYSNKTLFTKGPTGSLPNAKTLTKELFCITVVRINACVCAGT